MKPLQEKICLIVPCYNETQRLDIEKFKQADASISFIFVNDGSTDATLDLLKQHENNRIRVHSLEKNSGKAEAVRQGMLLAKKLPEFEELAWIGYWDADLSTSLDELPGFLEFQKIFAPQAKAIFGSRIDRLGSNISRSFTRHIIGRILATFFWATLKTKTYDSQCGAKLFKKELTDIAFSSPFITKWLFDVEITLLLDRANAPLVEYPLKAWLDAGGSKVFSLKAIREVFLDIFRLHRKYKQ